MTRIFAFLFAVLVALAGVGHARAQGFFGQDSGQDFNRGFDPGFGHGFGSPDIMRGGPDYYATGSSPIPRTLVRLDTGYAPGTIIVSTAERRLYLVLPDGQALRYGIGVGRDGFRWGGVHRISAKKVWPSWTPPSDMLARRPDLPPHMAGGHGNPVRASGV